MLKSQYAGVRPCSTDSLSVDEPDLALALQTTYRISRDRHLFHFFPPLAFNVTLGEAFSVWTSLKKRHRFSYSRGRTTERSPFRLAVFLVSLRQWFGCPPNFCEQHTIIYIFFFLLLSPWQFIFCPSLYFSCRFFLFSIRVPNINITEEWPSFGWRPTWRNRSRGNRSIWLRLVSVLNHEFQRWCRQKTTVNWPGGVSIFARQARLSP